MPIVQVQVWQGFGEERARKLIEGITATFQEVGVPPAAVEVVIQEVPRTHWGVGGQVAADRFGRSEESGERPSGAGYRGPREDRPRYAERGPGEDRPRYSERGPREDRPRYGERSQRDDSEGGRRTYTGRTGAGRDDRERSGSRERTPRSGARYDRGGSTGSSRPRTTDTRRGTDSRPGHRPRRGGQQGEGSSERP